LLAVCLEKVLAVDSQASPTQFSGTDWTNPANGALIKGAHITIDEHNVCKDINDRIEGEYEDGGYDTEKAVVIGSAASVGAGVLGFVGLAFGAASRTASGSV